MSDYDWGNPPAEGLIKCRMATSCTVCGRNTIWRGSLIDIHVCSPECFEHARDILAVRAH